MISLFYLDWASISRPVALIKRHELEAAFRESLHELMRSYPVSVIVRRRRKSITGQPNVAQDEVGSHLAARAGGVLISNLKLRSLIVALRSDTTRRGRYWPNLFAR